MSERLERTLAQVGKKSIHLLEIVGLIIIAIATIFAAVEDIGNMINAHRVTLADLLMLFLYLEVLAMTAIYLDSGKLPIRLPIYIAIVALARFLVLDMKELDALSMLIIAATILLLAGAVLVLRYGHQKFPYKNSERWGARKIPGRQAPGRHPEPPFTRQRIDD
ncbi:protein PsiE [Sulfurivirga caldicuralii]|uniref:Protein PsiE n=1 Tax=Sulfurivirga caldicuralii TaxID=364032 RepID=A0A1N6GVA5_9GAMM|nr:phosphate-starvation-inducible PsiE family protein [Sulfurivirga caldicuralii]SIO11490.1 protein PsiE [Sulfurivirga caldicuralii]